MAEQQSTAVGARSRASPWPVFVALGFVLSEAGVLFGVRAVSVGGIFLFSASVVGILRESGYVNAMSKPAFVLGALFGGAGAALYALTAFDFRGVSLLFSGAVLVLAALASYAAESGWL
jgi:hypothetical protein